MGLKINGKELNDNLIESNCPVCGSEERENLSVLPSLAKCLECSAVYVKKKFDEKTQLEVLKQYAAVESGAPSDGVESDEAAARINLINEAEEYIKNKGKIFEIECSRGDLLKSFKDKGYDVAGSEFNEEASNTAEAELETTISKSDFIQLDLKKNDFAAIAAINSLNKQYSPKESVEKIFNALEPGGVFFGTVPNIDSFGFEILSEDWNLLNTYTSGVFFTVDSLKRLLETAGLKLKKIETDSSSFDRDLLERMVADYYGAESEEDIQAKISELERQDKGEEIVFIAEKPAVEPTDKDFEKPKTREIEELETEVVPEEKEAETSEAEPKPKETDEFETIEIELGPNDDYEKILFDKFKSLKKPAKFVIIDNYGILPEYAEDWNGVEVIRKQREPEETMEEKESQKGKNEAPREEAMNRSQFKNDLEGGFSNKPATGEVPDPLPKPLYLNLGCGEDVREGFLNIDLYGGDPRVVRMDVRKLELSDESAELILASDILEHFSHRQTDLILKEWARVLKPNGNLIIRCPSLKLQMKAYMEGKWDADVASYMIFGGQTNPGDYHCVAFDELSIRKHLENAGFKVVEISEEDLPQDKGYINLNMNVRAKKVAAERKVTEISEETPKEKTTGKEPQEEPAEEEKIEPTDKLYGIDFSSLEDDESPKETEETAVKPEEESEAPEEITSEEVHKPELNIVWEGSQFVYHSFALINREHCSNIIESNLADLTVVPFEEDDFDAEENPKYEEIKKRDIRYKPPAPEEIAKLPYVWIRHQWPPKDEDPKGAKWIIMQPWEFSQLWNETAETFKKADEIWTPSNFSRQAIVNSGIDFDKVQIIPNGIAPEIFKPSDDKIDLPTDKKFKFLFVGGTIYRKGIDILLEAYSTIFSSEDDVCLVIKDMGGESFYKNINAKEKIEELRQKEGSPEIIYINDYLPDADMPKLYRSCDVFVSPYRGEGFSLPTLEAMSCGLPSVVTKGGSTDDFCDEETSWLIPAEKNFVGDKLKDKKLTGEAYLLEPDKKSLIKALRLVFDNPGKVYSAGAKASARARKYWTWKKATLKIFSRLDYLYGKNLAKKAEKKFKDEIDEYILIGEAENSLEKGVIEDAKVKLEKAVASDAISDKWKYHATNKLALISIIQNDYQKAEEYADKAAQIIQNHVDTKYLKAKIAAFKEDWASALEILTEVMNNWKYWKYDTGLNLLLDDILCDVAEGLTALGDLENAINLYKQALKLNDHNARACLGSGKTFLKGGAKEEAKNMFEWALKINPNLTEAKDLLNETGR